MKYAVKKFEAWCGEWKYMNSFKAYTEAVEEMEILQRRFPNATFAVMEWGE